MVEVFIVEDDSSLQMLYKLLLTSNGLKILDTASNGEEAIQKFKDFKKKPDIILMDHRMPNKSGLEAIVEILEIENKTSIIFVSADKSVRNQALEAGALDFIEKPFDSKVLIKKIQKVMTAKKKPLIT